jgi:hypothetical protein
LFETTPQVVSREIEDFCEGVVPGGTSVLVPVKPGPGAELNRCHVNVADHVLANGGEAVFGWIIWQSRVLLHAEAHCNWRSPQDELIDITPKADREAQVLFLPDPNMKWMGRLIPSRRAARINSPEVHDLIRLVGESDEIQAKYRPLESLSFRDERQFLSLQLKVALRTLEVEKLVRSVPRSAISTRQRKEKRKDQRRAKKRNRR